MKCPFLLLPGLISGLLSLTGPAARAGDALEDFITLLGLSEGKKADQLIPACEAFLVDHPGSKADDRVLYFLGHALVRQGRHEEGIVVLTRLLETHPGTPMKTDASMQRGEAFRNLKKLAESIPDFEAAWDGYRAGGSAENAAHAGFHLVQAHHALNQLEKARALAETLEKEYAGISYTRSALGVIGRQAAAAPVKGTLGGSGVAAPRPEPVPVGAAAPEIEFEMISDGSRKKLSDFKGKVVVLDFWASWCGPCQAPMAKMQTYRELHPSWGDKVELIALSIDNTREAAADHLIKKGWEKTTNAWAGEGGFRAAPPQAYRVSGIPTVYLIDAAGRVAASGHPGRLDIGELVDGLLKKN